MTDETLTKTLAGLRDDIDMLLNAHYSASPDGIAGMKTRIASAIANIDTLTASLSATNALVTQNQQDIEKHSTMLQAVNQYILPMINNNSDLIQETKDNFIAFLERFMTQTEQQSTIELADKVGFWSPYLRQLRKILDILSVQDAQDLKNMLSSGSTGGSTVSTELQQKVETNTTNIAELQSKVNANTANISSLQTQVAKYLTPPDPYYTGKTFTDYPAGTIIQTYDYDERNYDFSNSKFITTPTLYFCTEQSAVAKIKITSKVSLQTAGVVKINTFLNGTQIDEHNFDMLTDSTLQQVSFDIFDVNLNTEDKANNIYTTICYNNTSGNTVTLKYQKVEIVASNIMFLNKICPFYALYFNGKYHLTDCSSGTIKIAEIEAENMHNMNSLTWTDTQIPAQECQPAGSYNVFSGGSADVGELYHLKRTLDNKFYIGTLENNFQKKIFSSVLEMDYITQFVKTVNFASKTTVGYGTYLMYYDPTTNSMGRSTGEVNAANCVKLSGEKYYGKIPNGNIPSANIKHCDNGECYFVSKMLYNAATTYKLADGDISSILMTNFVNEYKYDVHAYIHHYDKTIRYDISFDKEATEKVTVNSVREIGTYDRIFEMPNNYYFAVKNNQLHFYRFEDETE